MFKQINIMLCFLLFFAFGHSSAQDNFKVFVPEFIPSNGTFEVSIITSKKFPESEKLNIYFKPDFSLIINKIELWTREDKKQLSVQSEFVEEYSEQYQKVSIDLTDTSLFSDESFFQLVVYLKSAQTTTNYLKFFGEFLSEEKILGFLTSTDSKIISSEQNIYNLSFSYYEKSFLPESAASLTENSYFNVPLVYNFEEVLAVEFWIKFKDSYSTFLEIINWETNWIEYYLSINENQMLVITSNDNEQFPIKPFFISQDIWYHVNINFNKQDGELEFFCNDEELARNKIQKYVAFDNLVLHFQNELSDGEINIDQFRLVNINTSFTAISENRNYFDYTDDSSNVIFQMNFSDSELNDFVSKKNIFYERIRLVKSDAPLFLRAPEISLKLLNNFYEIEWKGGSYKNADHYIIERAIGTGNFNEKGKQAADNNEEKTYSIVSEKYDQPEIVYFRIKQVNKDGSEIYSDVVKVGQGIIEDLIVGQNYPNPFNPTTLIEFELLQGSDVELKVYDLAGKEIALLHKGFLNSGVHQFKFDASGFPSGIYLYQIITPLSSQTRKMIFAK